MATLKELREKAKAYELKGYSKLNKAQLEELISKYDQAAQEATHKQQAQQKIVGISYFGTPVTEEEYRAAMVPAFIKKGKAIYETIKAADSLQSVIDFLKPLYCYDSLRHCATLLGIDVTHIKHELPRVSDIYKKLIIVKAQELFPDPQEATPETPDTQAVSDPETTAPTLVRFEIGRHYKEIGACDPDTYTFVGKCSRYYGIFVDSVHVYHRTKITNDGIAEHANARRVNGSPYGTGFLKADNEVCRHEIMSLVNGTSILLDANTVIHSYQELEAMLAPKSAPVQEVNTNSEATPDYDSAFDETAYSPDVQDVTVNIDDIPADHEPDIAPVSKPEREPWQKHICDHCDGTPAAWTHEQFIKGILLFYECNKLDHNHKFHMDPMIPNVFGINDYLKYSHSLVQLWKLARFFGLNIPKIDLTNKTHKTERKKHQIASIIAEEIGFMEHVYVCTYEDPGAPELPAELAEHIPEWRKETIARAQAMPVPVPIQEAKTETTANSELQPLSAKWDLLYAKFAGECTDIEIVRNKIRLANSCINLDTVRAYQEAHKTPATVSKSTPKPATRKPRHVKKLDDSRQLLISFDDAETPATVQPAKPNTRRASRPHVKKDYTRQLLINFGEDIASGQTDHRQAA